MRKGDLEDRFRRLAWSSCCCPLLSQLQVSWRPLEFRRKTAKIKGVSVLQQEIAVAALS